MINTINLSYVLDTTHVKMHRMPCGILMEPDWMIGLYVLTGMPVLWRDASMEGAKVEGRYVGKCKDLLGTCTCIHNNNK